VARLPNIIFASTSLLRGRARAIVSVNASPIAWPRSAAAGYSSFFSPWCWRRGSALIVLRRFTAFDPYPFILLNLILSCLAAVQAPIIMMSQNRMEARDRLRSENDYQVNLKAELEIRHLHEKLDVLLKHQWQKLLEIWRSSKSKWIS
jgi:hypothetical protein